MMNMWHDFKKVGNWPLQAQITFILIWYSNSKCIAFGMIIL